MGGGPATKEDDLETRLKIRRANGSSQLALAGELDLSTVEELSAALNELVPEGGRIVLDVSELSFMDSTGLRVLLDVATRLREGGTVVLRGPQDQVRRVIEISGVESVASNLLIED